MNVISIIAGASNVRSGGNPPFTAEDFKTIYPQFFDEKGSPLVPAEVLDMYLQFAHSCLSAARYRDSWRVCMGLFIAHFLTLYMQAMLADGQDHNAQSVVNSGQTRGLAASKSVGGASISYDFSTAMQDLDGWAAWKLTTFGTQFATLAKILTMGGMYVP